MFYKSNCLRLAIFSINIACCACYVNYEIFKGFDLYNNVTGNSPILLVDNHILESRNQTSNVAQSKNVTQSTNVIKSINVTEPGNVTESKVNESTKVTESTNVTKSKKGVKNRSDSIKSYNMTVVTMKKPSMKFKAFKMKCPETEQPMSLGTYEIPTQRDLVLFTKRTLVKMFNNYHEKTLLLLKDIREATRATQEYEKKCRGRDKATYRSCVKRVSKKCVIITKDLVALLENQKQSVNALIEEKTCNMNNMKTDPMQLVKTLAMDEASLEFALPAFLRLIGGCSTHCSKKSAKARAIGRPIRHMTDQDLVVKHFLTRKNYIQLIKDPDAHVQ